MTLEMIGKEFGVSRSRVHLICRSEIEKYRRDWATISEVIERVEAQFQKGRGK